MSYHFEIWRLLAHSSWPSIPTQVGKEYSQGLTSNPKVRPVSRTDLVRLGRITLNIVHKHYSR